MKTLLNVCMCVCMGVCMCVCYFSSVVKLVVVGIAAVYTIVLVNCAVVFDVDSNSVC